MVTRYLIWFRGLIQISLKYVEVIAFIGQGKFLKVIYTSLYSELIG